MRKNIFGVGFLFVASCGSSSSDRVVQGPPPPPPRVVVEFHDVTIAPTKVNGAPWDGPGGEVMGATEAIAAAMKSTAPYASALAVIAKLTERGLERPDVEGSIFLEDGSARAAMNLPKVQDSFTPAWPGVVFTGILDPGLRLRVDLTDADLMNDDPIGEVILNADDLAAALRDGHLRQIDVHEQNPQILFVGLSVRPI